MSLLSDILPEHLAAYKRRDLSPSQIAAIYSRTVPYVRRTLPKRDPRPPHYTVQKRILTQVRREYRDNLARKIPDQISFTEALELAHCSARTMFRHIKRVRT